MVVKNLSEKQSERKMACTEARSVHMSSLKEPSYSNGRLLLLAAVALSALAILYREVVVDLVRVWSTDSNYSHGFLIPPIALFLAWERRRRFMAAPLRVSPAGVLVVGTSLLVLVVDAGTFPTQISFVAAIAGTVLLLCGSARFRALAFPLGILLLMIPLPATVFERLESPLQTATSVLSEMLIRAVHVPVVRDRNFLALGNVTLEVARECSGIRTSISLLTLGLVFGYAADSRRWPRLMVVALTVPVVVLANSLRVAATAVSTHYYGATAATGFLHDLYGWLAFAAAFAILMGIHRLLIRAAPARPNVSAPSPNAFIRS